VASPLSLHNFYSILIRLLEPPSSEAEETWVRNMAAEFCLQSISFMLMRLFCMPSCYRFLTPLKIHRPRPGFNPRTLGPVASTLPLDHRGRPGLRSLDLNPANKTSRDAYYLNNYGRPSEKWSPPLLRQVLQH
jgi:hypothetical protein